MLLTGNNNIRIVNFSFDRDELIPQILKAAEETHKIIYQDERWFRWKFSSNPFGNPIVKVALTQEDAIAGMVSFSIADILVGKEVISAAYTTEIFVHPNFQRRGLFSALLDSVHSSAKKRGVKLLYIFPNSNSRPGVLRKGYTDIGGVESWILPTRPLKVFQTVTRNKMRMGTMKADLSKIKGPSANFIIPETVFFPLCKNNQTLAFQSRISSFLSWRFNTYPIYNYWSIITQDGWAILRSGQRQDLREIQLLDVFSFNQDFSFKAVRQVLAGIISAIKERNEADFISFFTTNSTRLGTVLRSLFFLKVANSINFVNLSLDKNMAPPSKWLLTGTDFHTF